MQALKSNLQFIILILIFRKTIYIFMKRIYVTCPWPISSNRFSLRAAYFDKFFFGMGRRRRYRLAPVAKSCLEEIRCKVFTSRYLRLGIVWISAKKYMN